MIDDEVILKIERLRGQLIDFQRQIRSAYSKKTLVVTAKGFRESASLIAEKWLVEVVGQRNDISPVITDEVFADITVAFQQLLTCASKLTSRKHYDDALSAILDDFQAKCIFPLKRVRAQSPVVVVEDRAPVIAKTSIAKSSVEKTKLVVFVGKSFDAADSMVCEAVERILAALGYEVITGEKPSAGTVSKKVTDRIKKADVFIGIFTRKAKIARSKDWGTSEWVIDEKAYAVALNKKLILLKEDCVRTIGGIQGDYEFIEFRREQLHDMVIKLVETLCS